MAKLVRNPVPAPEIDYLKGDWQDWDRQGNAYRERVRQAAKARGETGKDADLVGEIMAFPVADGHAEYMVWRVRPFTLVHLEIHDDYHIPDAHLRGLRLADARQHQAWNALWRQK